MSRLLTGELINTVGNRIVVLKFFTDSVIAWRYLRDAMGRLRVSIVTKDGETAKETDRVRAPVDR